MLVFSGWCFFLDARAGHRTGEPGSRAQGKSKSCGICSRGDSDSFILLTALVTERAAGFPQECQVPRLRLWISRYQMKGVCAARGSFRASWRAGHRVERLAVTRMITTGFVPAMPST